MNQGTGSMQGNPGMPSNAQLQHQMMVNQQNSQNTGPQMTPVPGHPGHPPHPSTQQHQQQQAQQQQQSNPHDYISRVRHLVWQMKESLSNLMKITATNITHNSQIDSGAKTSEEKVARFDKALEEFFSICNQIESHLRTIGECAAQHRDSVKYIPFTVSAKCETTGTIDNNVSPQEGAISYSQYLIVIKNQIHYAKNVQEILLDGVRQIKQSNEPMQQQMVPPVQNQQGQQQI